MYVLFRARQLLGSVPALIALVLVALGIQSQTLKVEPVYDESAVELALVEPEPEVVPQPVVKQEPPPPVIEDEEAEPAPPPPKPVPVPKPEPKPKPVPKPVVAKPTPTPPPSGSQTRACGGRPGHTDTGAARTAQGRRPGPGGRLPQGFA